MSMDPIQALRDHLVSLIRGAQAYDSFEDIVAAVPLGSRGVVPRGAEHSAWQILWHMQVSLRDILDYSQNADGTYQEKAWPEGYWPKSPEPPSADAWDRAVRGFQDDRIELENLAKNGDLFERFPWEPKHTLLREILLAADHAGYHCGQLVLVGEMV